MSKPTPLLTIFKVSTPMCFAYLLLVLEVHTDLWATHLRWKAQSRPEPLHTMGYSPEVESPKPPRVRLYFFYYVLYLISCWFIPLFHRFAIPS